jgi:hypothetical protein
MTKVATFFLMFLVLSCTQNQPKEISWDLSAYESYSLIELFPDILKANNLIRKIQLDSIANIKTGNSLLDEINIQQAKADSTSGKSIEDFPLEQVLYLNTKIDNYGKSFIDSTAIIGMIKDSITLRNYLAATDLLFPKNLDWKFSGNFHEHTKCLYAIKNDGVKISFNVSEIDTVFAIPLGLGKLISSVLKDKDYLNYWVEIKLNKEVSKTLNNKIYSIILKSDNCEYSGSIVNFKHNPYQRITIGEMTYNDFNDLNKKLPKRVKIRN